MNSRILNWILVVGLAVAGIWGYNQYQTRLQYETYIQNVNQKSYFDLVGNFENLTTLTSKSLVSTSSQNKTMLLSDVWWQANNAQQNLAQLPLDGGSVQRTTKFLTQLGDYSFALAKKSSKGLPISNTEVNKLQELHNEIGFLTEEIQRLNTKINKDGIAFSDLQKVSRTSGEVSKNLIDGTFVRLDKQMQEYPSLIYDGPFSDHIEQRKPRGVKGKILTTAEAKFKSMAFVDKAPGKQYEIKNVGMAKGKIPAYTMQLRARDASEEIYLDISRQGGNIIWMLNQRPVNMRTLSSTQAKAYALNFLEKNGMKSMVPSYAFRQGNVSVITFAYKEGDVIVYPDLVKVKVALDNGQIVGYEGLGYLMNHRPRKLPKAEYSPAKAREKIPSHLQVVSEKLTLIPTETLEEKLCYEFKVKLRGDTFLIYLNAISGSEEQILQVIDMPNGEWTM